MVSNQRKTFRVSDLLDDYGMSWNVERLKQVLHDSDAFGIKQIHVGYTGRDDYIAWNFRWNGVFTVRSAYHLKMSLKKLQGDAAESSSSVATHRGAMEHRRTEQG